MNCVGCTGCAPFLPRVARRRLRLPQPVEQPVPHAVRRVHRLLADLVDPDALDEVVGPLEIVGVLAVVLEEQLRRLERRLGRLDRDQQVGLAHRLAGGAADHHLPAAFLTDQADVLHRRLGAVARAADGRHLDLVRREQVLEAPLHLDAGARSSPACRSGRTRCRRRSSPCGRPWCRPGPTASRDRPRPSAGPPS